MRLPCRRETRGHNQGNQQLHKLLSPLDTPTALSGSLDAPAPASCHRARSPPQSRPSLASAAYHRPSAPVPSCHSESTAHSPGLLQVPCPRWRKERAESHSEDLLSWIAETPSVRCRPAEGRCSTARCKRRFAHPSQSAHSPDSPADTSAG